MLDFFRFGAGIDPGRALGVAMLLDEYARIKAAKNLIGTAERARRRSLLLLLEAMAAEQTLRTPEFEGRVRRLAAEIGDENLERSADLKLKALMSE